MILNKKILNFIVIISLTIITFGWTFFIFHLPFDTTLVVSVIIIRIIASLLIFKDYSLSWSKATQKTFLLKSIVYIVPFFLYGFYFHGEFRFALLISELFFYIFAINFLMYSYHYYINRSGTEKTKHVVIYGAGKAGIKLESEFINSEYKVSYFCDDDQILQGRSIDGVRIVSSDKLKEKLGDTKYDLLVIAMPSVSRKDINKIYKNLSNNFKEIKILPSIEDILQNKDFTTQLKEISVEDLLARHPADLDKDKISSFIKNKTVLITGAGGSIGSELVRQCVQYNANKIIILDHSEFNLYQIEQEVIESGTKIIPIMHSVVTIKDIDNTFKRYTPDIVLHAAAYKHVPLVESNISTAIVNNIIGTKNVVDISIKYKV
ncbi:MAG: SDR family NAD(P)-dependent oxidoreductase, partial [Campylobacterota bacterium]|nr:SDR family NAD(P)-dependent oxidoreductase [Campylobacterota bacterium]